MLSIIIKKLLVALAWTQTVYHSDGIEFPDFFFEKS